MELTSTDNLRMHRETTVTLKMDCRAVAHGSVHACVEPAGKKARATSKAGESKEYQK